MQARRVPKTAKEHRHTQTQTQTHTDTDKRERERERERDAHTHTQAHTYAHLRKDAAPAKEVAARASWPADASLSLSAAL